MPSTLNLCHQQMLLTLSTTASGPAGLWNRPLPEPCNSLGHQSHFPLFFLTLLWDLLVTPLLHNLPLLSFS